MIQFVITFLRKNYFFFKNHFKEYVYVSYNFFKKLESTKKNLETTSNEKLLNIKCLRHGDLKENFKSTGRRDLNIKYTNFDRLKCWEYHAYEYNHLNACDAATNATTMNIYWLGHKLISNTGEEGDCLLPLLG